MDRRKERIARHLVLEPQLGQIEHSQARAHGDKVRNLHVALHRGPVQEINPERRGIGGGGEIARHHRIAQQKARGEQPGARICILFVHGSHVAPGERGQYKKAAHVRIIRSRVEQIERTGTHPRAGQQGRTPVPHPQGDAIQDEKRQRGQQRVDQPGDVRSQAHGQE